MTNWSVTWQNVLSQDRLYYHIKDLIVTWQDVLSYDGFDFHITDWVVTWRAGFSDDRLDYHWTGSLMIWHVDGRNHAFWCYEQSFSLYNCSTWKKALLQARKHFRCDILLTGIKDGTTFVLNRLLLQPPPLR